MSCGSCSSAKATRETRPSFEGLGFPTLFSCCQSRSPRACPQPCVTYPPCRRDCTMTIYTPPVPCGPYPPKCVPYSPPSCPRPSTCPPKCFATVTTRPLSWIMQLGCTVTIPGAPKPGPSKYVPNKPCCRPGCFHKPRPVCCRYLYWRLPCKANCFQVS